MILNLKNLSPSEYSNNLDKIKTISQILDSYDSRNHIILCKRNDLRSIINSSLYSHHTKIIANDLIDKQIEYHQLLQDLIYHVEVDFSYNSIEVIEKDEKKIIRASYIFFQTPQNNLPTTLISEDISDVDFYIHMARTYAQNILDSKPEVKFTSISGGGSQIKNTFTRHKEDNKLCLCIFDNDRKHPLGCKGSTASLFKERDKTLDKTGLAIELELHEVESFIPINSIEDLIKKGIFSHLNNNKNVDLIFNLLNTEPSTRKYFDLKNGISYKKAEELDNKYGAYWIPILINLNQENENLEELAIPGIGGKLLTNFNQLISGYTYQQLNETLDDFIREYWINLGLILTSWGCTPPSQKSRC
jgi:hypothetical protein